MKRLLVFLLVVLLMPVALVLSFLWYPQLYLNNSNFDRAVEYLSNYEIKVETRARDLRVENISFFRKHIFLHLETPCVRRGDEWQACFTLVDLDAVVTFARLIPRIEIIKRLEVADANITVASTEENETTGKNEAKDRKNNLLSFLNKLKWEHLHVGLTKFAYRWDDKTFQAEGDLTGTGDDKQMTARLRAKGSLERGQLKDVGFEVLASLKGGVPLLANDEPELNFDGAVVTKSLKGHLHGVAQIGREKIRMRLDGRLDAKRNLVLIRRNEPCEITAGVTGLYKLNCPLRFPVNPRFVKAQADFPMPDTIGLGVSAKWQNAFPPDLEKTFRGGLDLKLLALETEAFKAEGTARAAFDISIPKLPEFNQLKTSVNFSLNIFAFEKLVAELKSSKFAVPAPLDVLKGAVKLTIAKGEVDFNSLKLPFVFRTGLKSKDQEVNTSGTGRFTALLSPKFKPSLDLRLNLERLRLVAPRVEWPELRTMPQLRPDPRIKQNGIVSEATAAPSKFNYRVALKTQRPAEIISNLASQPIPINLDLRIKNPEGVRGQLEITEFPVVLFRRDAKLEFLRLNFGPISKTITARAHVGYTDYTIYISVTGEIEKPKLDVESTPPAPRDQLLAVLVLGRSLHELDSDQQSSVKNLEGALTDGVLGYYSLYYLASTPVESVGYDPKSKMVTAKVRLQEGVSLNVGLNEERELGLIGVRRRVGRNWVLTTEVEDPFASGAQNVSTFLEWLLRY